MFLILEAIAAIEEQVLQQMFLTEQSEWCCSICGKKGKLKHDIFRHIESNHITNHPGYSCDFCDVVVKSRNALRQHRNSKHKLF